MRLAVGAERHAATDRGEAIKIQAESEAEAERIRIISIRARAEADAEGARLMNESLNMLTPEARVSLFRQKLLDKVEGIVRESVRPLERIEGIKILSVNGLGANGNSAGEGGVNLPEQLVNSALRFRAQAPLIDGLLKEIGIDAGGASQIAQSLLGQTSGERAA